MSLFPMAIARLLVGGERIKPAVYRCRGLAEELG
jgi:hypothetical protein